MDFSKLGDLAKQMEDTYSSGLSSVDQASEAATSEINPDHEIKVGIKLNAKIEDREYSVDSDLVFEIELNSVLESANSSGDIGSLLDGLGVDLGTDKDAVMEQLGQPRAVGRVKKIKTKKLEVSDKKGKVKAELNKKGTILATIKDGEILFNFDGVFSYKNPNLLIAIPSTEKMQENIRVKIDDLKKEVEFEWVEKNKDNLKISGTLQVLPLGK